MSKTIIPIISGGVSEVSVSKSQDGLFLLSEEPKLIVNGREVTLIQPLSETNIEVLPNEPLHCSDLMSFLKKLNITTGILSNPSADTSSGVVSVKLNNKRPSVNGNLIGGNCDLPKVSSLLMQMSFTDNNGETQNLEEIIDGFWNNKEFGYILDGLSRIPESRGLKSIPPNFEDSEELIRDLQVSDYLTFDTIYKGSQNSKTELSNSEFENIYLDEESNSKKLQFSSDKLSDIVWGVIEEVGGELKLEKLPTDSVLSLSMYGYITPVSPIQYKDHKGAKVVEFNGSPVYYKESTQSLEGGSKFWVTTLIKISDSVVKTPYFLVDISKERLIIYPWSTDMVEYQLQSAKLINVIC